MKVRRSRMLNLLIASLVLSLAGISQVQAEKAGEEESNLNTKTVDGVHFLVEKDREITKDPITGLLIPEPMDRYLNRKLKTLKEAQDQEMESLQTELKNLGQKVEALERMVRHTEQVQPPEPVDTYPN